MQDLTPLVTQDLTPLVLPLVQDLTRLVRVTPLVQDLTPLVRWCDPALVTGARPDRWCDPLVQDLTPLVHHKT